MFKDRTQAAFRFRVISSAQIVNSLTFGFLMFSGGDQKGTFERKVNDICSVYLFCYTIFVHLRTFCTIFVHSIKTFFGNV